MATKVPWGNGHKCCCDSCLAPSIKCDSVAVEKGKVWCGYWDSETGKYYSKRTDSEHLDSDETSEPEYRNTGGGCAGMFSYRNKSYVNVTATYERTKNESGICQETVTWTGSTILLEETIIDIVGVQHHMKCESSVSPDGTWSGTYEWKVLDCPSGEVLEEFSLPANYPCQSGPSSTTFSDEVEYPLSQLIAEAEAALPAFPGTYAGSCISSRHVSEDEESISLAHSKAKFYYATALPEDKRVTIAYKIILTPESGSPTETTGTTTIEPGESESEEIDLPIPSENGARTIEFMGVTCETV